MSTQGYPLRIHPVSKELARVATTGTTNTTATVRATIRNPSRRLSCCFTIAFETPDGQRPANYSGADWTVRAMRKNRITGRTAPMHLLQDAIELPAGYELDSAIREIEVAADLTVPVSSAPAAIAGSWVLLVEWEPNQPSMCDDEIERLFADCDVGVDGVPPLLVP